MRWAPIPFELPEVVSKTPILLGDEHDANSPNLAKEYEEDGALSGCSRQDDKDASGTIIWQLAKRIQVIYYSQMTAASGVQPE